MYITASRQFIQSWPSYGRRGQASLVKLLACKLAEWVSREAMQIHGGMGYAEKQRLYRFESVIDFRRNRETLALKVVGKALLDDLVKVGVNNGLKV